MNSTPFPGAPSPQRFFFFGPCPVRHRFHLWYQVLLLIYRVSSFSASDGTRFLTSSGLTSPIIARGNSSWLWRDIASRFLPYQVYFKSFHKKRHLAAAVATSYGWFLLALVATRWTFDWFLLALVPRDERFSVLFANLTVCRRNGICPASGVAGIPGRRGWTGLSRWSSLREGETQNTGSRNTAADSQMHRIPFCRGIINSLIQLSSPEMRRANSCQMTKNTEKT